MIITCPQCSTNYNVSAAMIGGGKNTRCSNCGHNWFQIPVPEPKISPNTKAQPSAPGYPVSPAPMPPNQMAPPGYAPIPGQYFLPPGYYPHPQPIQAGQPGASSPTEPATNLPTNPTNVPSLNPQPIKSDEMSVNQPQNNQTTSTDGKNAVEGGEVKDQNEKPENAPTTDLTEEQLDDMFGEDGEPEVIPSMMGGGGQNDGISDPDQIEDPDPIPQVMAAGPASGGDSPKKSKTGLIIGTISVVLLLSLIAAVIFLKSIIIKAIPATESIYEMVGLGGSVLGEGLDLKVGKSSFETENGKEVLIVKGIIKNISEDNQDVPLLKVSLFDQNDKIVQSLNIPPRKSQLAPGRRLRFKARIESPSSIARRAEVTFASPNLSEPKKNPAKKD